METWGSNPGRGTLFHLLQSVQAGYGTRPASSTIGISDYILGVKRPEREAGNCHTLPTFNNTCNYTTILHKPNGAVHNGTTNSGSK
jgi:hypothetical protein